jgi:hypothetical protein
MERKKVRGEIVHIVAPGLDQQRTAKALTDLTDRDDEACVDYDSTERNSHGSTERTEGNKKPVLRGNKSSNITDLSRVPIQSASDALGV